MRRWRRQAGFTLVEMLVVITVIGLITYMVYVNLGAMVPKTRLDSAAKQLVARIDYLRSEARIQGKRYVLQLDLKQNRWRFVLPAEQRISIEQTDDDLAAFAHQWSPLDDGVRFHGAGNPIDGMVRDSSAPYEIVFDENGFTADQIVSLGLTGEDDKMIWTVQIHGLTGQCEILTSFDGIEQQIDEVGEGAF